ncbi:MAG TPA: PepSY domain-containing protein [Drouetiella sp.]
MHVRALNLIALVPLLMCDLNTAVVASPPKSSIQATYVIGRAETLEEMNTPRLKKMAKITKARAINIARTAVKGAVGRVDLENEDGNVIWSVEIGGQELAIDAGNGKILSFESLKSSNAQTELKSSPRSLKD